MTHNHNVLTFNVHISCPKHKYQKCIEHIDTMNVYFYKEISIYTETDMLFISFHFMFSLPCFWAQKKVVSILWCVCV